MSQELFPSLVERRCERCGLRGYHIENGLCLDCIEAELRIQIARAKRGFEIRPVEEGGSLGDTCVTFVIRLIPRTRKRE